MIYSHRSTVLHSLVSALPDSLSLSRRDAILLVVPMFHVNAWGLPYTAALVGARLLLPGPHLDAENLLDLAERERATVGARGCRPSGWASATSSIHTRIASSCSRACG